MAQVVLTFPESRYAALKGAEGNVPGEAHARLVGNAALLHGPEGHAAPVRWQTSPPRRWRRGGSCPPGPYGTISRPLIGWRQV